MCTSTCPLASGKVNEVNVYCPVKVRVEAALQKCFPKFSGFCPGQLEALLALHCTSWKECLFEDDNLLRKEPLHVPCPFSSGSLPLE